MKTIYDLGPGSILLVPSYLHTSIREALLASQNGLLGLKLYTLDGWLLPNKLLQKKLFYINTKNVLRLSIKH